MTTQTIVFGFQAAWRKEPSMVGLEKVRIAETARQTISTILVGRDLIWIRPKSADRKLVAMEVFPPLGPGVE
jgi:hypothetical protein